MQDDRISWAPVKGVMFFCVLQVMSFVASDMCADSAKLLPTTIKKVLQYFRIY